MAYLKDSSSQRTHYTGKPAADSVSHGARSLPAVSPLQKKKNETGLPDNLKSGIESLSGMSMDNVNVHYNSDRPAQLNALAYAQGSDIHVAPGQEKHLPHEAWHVVQQAQGRVKPTMQMKQGVPVNDDPGLENEADVMGAKALALPLQLQGPEEELPAQGKFETAQLVGPEEEEPLQGKFETLQRMAPPEEEDLLQGKFDNLNYKVNNQATLSTPFVMQKVSIGKATKPTPAKNWEAMPGFVSKHIVEGDLTKETAKEKWAERWKKDKKGFKNTVVSMDALSNSIKQGNVSGSYPLQRGARAVLKVNVKGYTVKKKYNQDLPGAVQELSQIGLEGSGTESLFYPDHLDPETST